MSFLESMMAGAEISDRIGASRRQRNQETLSRLVGGQIAQGDYRGGASALLNAGDLQGGMQLQGMADARRQQEAQASYQLATKLKAFPEHMRAQQLPSLVQPLQQMGLDVSSLSIPGMLSDQTLDGIISSLGPMFGPPPPEPMNAYQTAQVGLDRERLALDQRKFEADQASPTAAGDAYAEPFRHPDLGYGQFDAEGRWYPIEVEENTDAGATGDPSARLYTAGKSIQMANDAIETANPLNTGAFAFLRSGFGGQSRLESQIEMLKANNAFLGLAELASQGVRLTPISNADLQVAGNMVANLDVMQGTETLKTNLRSVRDRYLNIYQQVLRGVQEQYPDGNVPPNVAAVVRMFEDAITAAGGPEGGPQAGAGNQNFVREGTDEETGRRVGETADGRVIYLDTGEPYGG